MVGIWDKYEKEVWKLGLGTWDFGCLGDWVLGVGVTGW